MTMHNMQSRQAVCSKSMGLMHVARMMLMCQCAAGSPLPQV